MKKVLNVVILSLVTGVAALAYSNEWQDPSVNEVNGHSVNITNDPPKKTKPCTTIIIYKSGN